MNDAFVESWEDPNACEIDGDCVLIQRALECPRGAELGFCWYAVHARSTTLFRQTVRDTGLPVCAQMAPVDARNCLLIPDCLPPSASCQSGRCVTVE